MKKIFINEVVKYALIIGISVVTLVWASLSRSTLTTLEGTLENYLQSASNILKNDAAQQSYIKQVYENTVYGLANNIAFILNADKSIMNNQERLDNLRTSMMLDEISILNEGAQVIAVSSSSKEYKNNTVCINSSEFFGHTTQADYKKYFEPVYCDRYKSLIQYTAVARQGLEGIVLIGRKSESFINILKSDVVANMSSLYPIHNNGFILAIDKDSHAILSYKDSRYIGVDIKDIGIDVSLLRSATKISKVKIENKDAFALLRDSGEYSLIAIAYKKDVYFTVYVYLSIILVSILLMIVFMQLFMLQVVNQHIISGISYIIGCLNSITKDNLNTRVELNTCDEFSILSESINSMVSRLRELLVKEQKLVKEKESLAAAKGEFLAMMSHEIRTPLNVIIGMAQIGMRSNFDDEKKKATFADINIASTHLLSLLNDILDMSKIDAGKLELFNSPFSLEENIEHLQLLISAKAQAQELILNVETSGLEGISVIGDKLRLNQVLLNLLSNAVKFTPKNKNIYLSVKVLTKSEKDVTIEFIVQDEGIGMTQEKIDKIFKPFEQADNSITRSFGGTGLGLSISQSIVELMGGTIFVESTENHGSKFWFDITFKLNDSVNVVENINFMLQDGSLSEYRALIVDDVLLNRKVISTFLEKTGIKMDEAESGEEAIKKYIESPVGYYNIIFMDIHMPNMNGYEATDSIRRSNKMDALTIPIIAVTADAFKETEDRVLSSGMNGFLSKPINLNKLSSAIIRALKHQFNDNETIMVWTKINNLD